MELFNFKDIAPFREPALMFDKYGYYTDAAVDTNEYNRYWDVQEQRCLEGYTVDDIRITGDHYWYLNFSRIDKKDSNEGGKKTTQKIEGFPDFWDGDYIYYHVLDIARNGITKEAYEKLKLPVKIKEEDLAGGKHLGVLKTRRRGYSYKNAALATKYYSLIRKSTIYLTAFEKELFSTIVAMTSQNLNFLSEHTGFGKTRDYINKLTADNFHVEASHKKTLPDGKEIKKGYLSQIKAISFKDDPNSLRGKSASLVLFEEAGSFPILKDAWNITRPSLEDGKFITGTMIAFGCVCKGTKVWTNKGEQINIEELVKEDGIIGYGGKFATKEPIVWMKPPAVKPCYRITTINGNHIECSNDHPLLWSKQGFNKNKENRKTVTFKKAEDIKVGEQLMFIRQIPVFGKERMWNPRLLGLLVGDGYYGNKSTPELSIDSDEVYDWVKGNYSKVTLHKEFDTKLGYKYRSVTLPGSAFELKQIGMYGQTWDNKHLPTNIYSCDIHSITEFIGGYFDADGAITYNKKKNVLRLSLTSKYKHLLEEVKVLLYKLNIGCSIVKENRKSGYKPGEVYRLYIAKLQDVLEFKKHIKFITKRKQDMLDSFDIAGRKGQRTYTNCLFKVNPDVNKGTYYLQDGRNHLDNLDALTVKSVEYIGEKEVYNLNAGMTHTYITNGFISGNTGGDAGSMDFIDMFNNPEPYNMIALENVWSDNKSGTFVSFFAPDYLNRVGFIDTNGNSDWEAAKIYETAERDKIIKTSNDSSVIDKRKAEYPFTPEEAVLSINANKFPVGDLANQLAKLESNRKYFDAEFNGSFIINELNEPEFRIDSKATPIRSFPPRGGEDISGCITIWEHPYKNNDDKVPYGMYVAGIDPVALEEAPTSTSINSTFIFNTMTNTIVAEYSGRLNNSKEYYEQVRRLIKYYNAVLLYENMVTGIFDYFDYKEELYLLADPPQILANLISDSRVKRKKGCHMTPAVKAHGVDLINNWLRDDSNDEGISNVYNIRSTGLLKELINYNKEDNFDRVFGMIMTLIQSNETRRTKEDPDIQVALTKNQKFFHKRIFTKTGGLRTGTLVKILNETV